MANKQAISATIKKANVRNLASMAVYQKKHRSELLDEIIEVSYREWLRKELAEAGASQDKEDVEMAEMGMADYWEIINRDER